MQKSGSQQSKSTDSVDRHQASTDARQLASGAARQMPGNLAVQGLLQPKLAIGHSDDPYEKEADVVANQLIKNPSSRQPPPAISSLSSAYVQRLCESCEEQGPKPCCESEYIQATSTASPADDHAGHMDFSSLQSGGKKLPEPTQRFFESGLGPSLDHVRLHTDANAARASRDINARAFTLNNHIAFAPGQYAPGTDSGRWLLAHELTHVLQQSAHSNMLVQRLGDNPMTDEWVSRMGQSTYESSQRARRRHERWTRSHRAGFHRALDEQGTSLAEDIASTRGALPRHRMAMLQQVTSNQQSDTSAAELSGFSGIFQRQPHLPADLMQNWARAELARETLQTSIEAEEVSDETAEVTRTAFNVFFQSLLQASRAQERYEASLRREYQQLQNDMDNSSARSAICHGGCHRSAPAPSFGPGAFPGLPSSAGGNSATAGQLVDNNARFDANPEGWVDTHTDSIVIKVRVAMHLLAAADTLAQWQRVLTEYGAATGVLDNLLIQRLPRSSELVQSFEYARDLLARQERFQNDYPDAVKIPAVFYPDEQFATVKNTAGENEQVARGIPWMFYLTQTGNPSSTRWAPDFEWVLHDLTSAGRPSVRLQPTNVLKAVSTPATFVDPPVELFAQLNHKLKFPKGYLYWTAPSGQRWSMPTTEPWTLSDWLTAIGVSIAVLGIVLGTAGYGTPAAIALIASAGVSVGATLANIAELREHNLLTQRDIDRATLSIALDVVSALTLGLGRVASVSLQTAGRTVAAGARGTAMAARATSMASRASRLWFISQTVATAGEGVNLYVAAQDFIQQARMIQSQQGLTEQQRNDAMGRLVLTALITGGLMIMSLRGNLKDLRRGTPMHIDIDPETGAPRLRPDVPEQLPGSARTGAGGEAAEALEGSTHRGLQPGARGSIELEGQSALRNAAGENHQFGLWQDGRITRCSDFCTDLTDNVLQRMRRMRERVPHNSAHIEELRQVAAEAQALRREAATAAGDAGTLASRRQQLLNRARALEMRASIIEEQVNRELSAFYSRAPRDWPLRQVDYDTLPRDLAGNIDTLPHGVVFEFPGGHRVWRLRGGGIAHESYVGPAHGRQHFEREFYRPGEAGRRGHHRAHTLGQGTGFESPFAIPYAPARVNLAIQNDGIEEFLRGLRDEAPAGTHFHVRTETHMRPGSLDLESITYRVEVSQGGRRAEFFEFDIQVGGTPDNPVISYGIPQVTQDPGLAGLFSMVDVPARVRNRWGRSRARSRTRGGRRRSGGGSTGSVQRKPASGGDAGSRFPVSDRPARITPAASADVYEKQADAVAHKVSHGSTASSHAPRVQLAPDISAASQAGSPVDEHVRNRIEPVLGADLSSVRVHADSRAQRAARAINARAFTHRNHIYLGTGESRNDTELMAHEATHSVQQAGGRPASENPDAPAVSAAGPDHGGDYLQRWDGEDEALYPTCQSTEGYANRSYHVSPEAGEYEIPSEVALHLEVPLPLLEAQRNDLQQPATVTFLLNQPVEMATTSIFYAVPRDQVYPSSELIPPAVCREPLAIDELEQESSITGPHVTASVPLPPAAFTMDAVIDVIAETPEVVITTTYTKMAVGAGSTTVLRTHSDYMLIDAGINSIGGNVSADLVEATMGRLVEINPSGHFREIMFSHGHADHVSIAPEVARQFSIGTIRTNALQLLMETGTGAQPFQEMLREVYTNQEALMEQRLRAQARTQAEAQAAEMPYQPDEGLRRARIESLTDAAYESLRSSRTPVALEALVPSEAGLGVVRTSAPRTTLPQALEIGRGAMHDTHVESPSEGLRRASFGDPEMRSQLETGRLPSERADRHSSSYIIELPNGNHLIVIPDVRTTDIVRQIEAMEAAMTRLGQPMRFRVWDATHHMQSGFIVSGSSFARMVQLLTRLTGVETRAGGPSAEAIAVSVRDAAITGDVNRSLVDPALAFLMRSLGYEVFLTMGGQDIRVIEAMIGEQRVSGIVGEPYAGRAPGDLLVRRAGSTLTYLQERIDSGTGDRAALRAHQRAIRDALGSYYEGVGSEIGRSDVGGTSARPEVLPAPAPPEAEAAPPRIADTQAQALIDAMQPVEAMEGYTFRSVGRIPILNEYALIILNLQDLASLSDNGREFLRNRQRLLSMEAALPEGGEVAVETVTEYLQLLRTQRHLLRGVLSEADVPGNRTALQAELSSIEARISATEASAGLVTEGSRITMPGGRTLEVEVTTNEAIPTRAQWGRLNRGAARILEASGRPMGGIMVAFTLRAQEELGQRIEEGEIPPLQALIGTTHNAYGIQVGMRMMTGIRVSPYEFVVLAAMDVFQTMAGDYGSDEMWWTQVTSSGIRNSIQMGLLFFAEYIGSRHPAAALLSLGLMFVVDPLLQASGFYAWLERVFAFAPSDITYVDQRLRDDLLPEYRMVVGALQLAERSSESLTATGMGDTADIQTAIRNHRQEAQELDEDIMDYFADAYAEAATSYVGLRELDIMRAEFLRLRHLAFAGTEDSNLDMIRQRFSGIESSLSLDTFTAEQVSEMDQWDEMEDALSSLNGEIYRTDYDSIDWDDVLDAQEHMDMMLRNARYRLNPGAINGRVLRSAALITPQSPGYETYVSKLDDIELRYRGVLEMARTGETRAETVQVTPNAAHIEQLLDEYGAIMNNMDAIPDTSSVNHSPLAYRSYTQGHATVLRNLRRLRVLEMGAGSMLSRLRFDRMSNAELTEAEAEDVLDKEARLRDLVQQRRETHGFIFESELSSYQTPARLQEDRQLLQALSPRDTLVRPFTAEEMAALTSEELEDESEMATTVANQIALWRQQTPGMTTQIYLLNDPHGESIVGGVEASAGAIVGFVCRSPEMVSLRGHYRLMSVIPLNRAAVTAIGRTLQGERVLWGGADVTWVHPDVLLRVPMDELDQVLQDPASYASRLTRPFPN